MAEEQQMATKAAAKQAKKLRQKAAKQALQTAGHSPAQPDLPSTSDIDSGSLHARDIASAQARPPTTDRTTLLSTSQASLPACPSTDLTSDINQRQSPLDPIQQHAMQITHHAYTQHSPAITVSVPSEVSMAHSGLAQTQHSTQYSSAQHSISTVVKEAPAVKLNKPSSVTALPAEAASAVASLETVATAVEACSKCEDTQQTASGAKAAAYEELQCWISCPLTKVCSTNT